jgi:hypothetical protein
MVYFLINLTKFWMIMTSWWRRIFYLFYFLNIFSRTLSSELINVLFILFMLLFNFILLQNSIGILIYVIYLISFISCSLKSFFFWKLFLLRIWLHNLIFFLKYYIFFISVSTCFREHSNLDIFIFYHWIFIYKNLQFWL